MALKTIRIKIKSVEWSLDDGVAAMKAADTMKLDPFGGGSFVIVSPLARSGE